MSRKTRKRKLGVEEEAAFDWENKNILSSKLRTEMERMWEIPQIFQFLQLNKEALNISHLSMYEVERMLLMPRASKQLAHIMTSLLSSPSIAKVKLRKIPPMPYEFWTNILAYKLKSWFKIYHSKHQDTIKVFDLIGVEPQFWTIFPNDADIDGKDFEDFTFKQRVWILKTVCDTVLHSRKTVQEELAKQPWENQCETVLGTDRYGARYVYFPQFLHNDLRVYRHCLDNKILSTVKPPPVQKVEIPPEVKLAEGATPSKTPKTAPRMKKRRSRWRNGSLPTKWKKREKRQDFKSGVDSGVSSIANDDTSMSSTSGYSNNNHLSQLDDVSKRSRSSSKASEVSTVRSSGYDTNISSDTLSIDEQQKVKPFRGFKNEKEVKPASSVNVVCGIIESLSKQIEAKLDAIETEINDCSEANDGAKDETLEAHEDYEEGEECSKSLSVADEVSKSSKTDDEKLEEMNATKPNAPKTEWPSFPTEGDNEKQFVQDSKSDDDKLSHHLVNDEKEVLGTWLESLPKKSANEDNASESSDSSHHTTRRSARLKQILNVKMELDEMSKFMDLQYDSDEELASLEIRDRLCRQDSDVTSNDDNGSERIDAPTPSPVPTFVEESIMDASEFNSMMSDLGESHFQLVADSVESFRDLIIAIPNVGEDPTNSRPKRATGQRPVCEARLVKRMSKLLESLEKVESLLKESTRKARTKLQKEWSNFLNGVVEDQDSSVEDGLTSNWWVLGSQGCPLSTIPGDASLTTLPSSAISPIGSQDTQEHQGQNEADQSKQAGDVPASEPGSKEGPNKEADPGRNAEDKSDTKAQDRPGSKAQNRKGSKSEDCKTDSKSEDRTGSKSEDETGSKAEGKAAAKRKEKATEDSEDDTGAQEDDHESETDSEQEEPENKRVLRARGVSSYTEQFYSDDDSEAEKLDGWTDIEAIYASPCTQANSPSAHAPAKSGESTKSADAEDSDQEWILPSSRKRKNKRSSANRRLKTFQHKIYNINAHQEFKESDLKSEYPKVELQKIDRPRVVTPSMIKETKESQALKTSVPSTSALADNATKPGTNDKTGPMVVPFKSIGKVESADSLHSVLDIKDEGPIYEPCRLEQGSYIRQNYVPVTAGQSAVPNYYVMQQTVPATTVVQQGPYGQPAAYQVAPQVQSRQPNQQQAQRGGPTTEQMATPRGVYVQQQGGQSYVVRGPPPPYSGHFPTPRQRAPIHFQNPRMVGPQQRYPNAQSYVQYAAGPGQQPRLLSAMLQAPPRHPAAGPRARMPVRARMPMPRPGMQHPPNGAVIRSGGPIGNAPRVGPRIIGTRHIAPRPRIPAAPRMPTPTKPVAAANASSSKPKTTSLIVLSDSDDDIEMIVTEKGDKPTSSKQQKAASQQKSPSKSTLSPQFLHRMNQGGISITPIKPSNPPVQASSTQLVVVVNETGSHYALALPNGSKLILTPDQVAQIRAANGGKLVL